ncbi:MAG: hypothetical protein E7403_04325 [Ruminococcaceae bacterium]|nr:hypothetical protein [Oscillospiraceae bacterium]
MKRVVTCFLILIMTLSAVISASAARITPPFKDHIIGDRLDKNMPVPFSVENVKSELLAQTDFGSVQENLTVMTWSMGTWTTDNGVLKIEKTAPETLGQKVYAYTGSVESGAYYAFVCKIKEENYTGSVKPRSILSAYQGNTWRGESGSYLQKGQTDANGFYTLTQVICVPEGANQLRLTAQMDVNTCGTVTYDDFKLYKIHLDPLESILVKPAYKGFIYGDGIADIDVDVKITESPNEYLLSNMTLSVELLTENDEVLFTSESSELQERMNVTFSSKGLPEGNYYVSTKLFNKTTGELISRKEHTIRKVSASYRPDFYVDEDGHAVRNGEKTFFKKIYNAQNDYAAIANDIKDTAVDSIGHNGMGWWFSNTNENMAEAFSILNETGKTMHLSLMGYWWGNRELDVNMFKSMITDQRDIRPFFQQIVEEHKETEFLDGYYIFDEPSPILYGEEIRWNQEILSSLDADHPTYGITDGAFDNYGIFTKMVDVLGIDPYPVSGKETDDIAIVGRSVRQIEENFPNRPMYVCLQGFNWRGRYGEGSRGPNYTELRNMAYQAICEGADGLDCYAYQAMMNDPEKSFEQWWSELTTLYADVEKYEKIILSSEPAPTYTVSGGGDWLNITARRYNGKSYLFAVNNTRKTQSATVKMDGGTTAVADTGATLTQGASGYALSFEPLEVKILEITQGAYLSHESELLSMGFFNCKNAYPVVLGEENILQVTDDSVIINYRAQISEKAKLFINGVEKPLAGKISLKRADSFTVTVVAEDGRTKTTTKYLIDRQ